MTREWPVRILAIAVATGFLRANAALPVQPEPGYVARMRQTVQIPDPGPAPLGAVAPGDVLVCPGEVAEGYQVVARDEAGEERMALLPYRSEWGHTTARSAAFDTRLGSGTVVVTERADLRPGACPLVVGRVFPLVSSNVTALTVRFQAGGLIRDLVIPRSYADVSPAAPVSESMEERTERALQASNDRQRDLRESLREAELRMAKLTAMLSQLRMGEVETARLTAELARSTVAYRQISQWKPQDPGAGAALKARLAAAIAEQAALVAQVQCAAFDIEPLRELQSLLADTAGQTQGLKADAIGKKGEADALAAGRASDEAVAGRKQIEDLLDRARSERSDLAGLLTQAELDRLSVAALFERLKTVKEENARLNDRIADLAARFGELRDALAAPDPGAPVAPKTTP